MNKYDRRKLVSSIRKYCSIVLCANTDFSEIIDSMKSKEEEKLDNIPDNLKDGCQASNIQEAIDQLASIQESAETIEETCEEIADTSEVDLQEIKAKRRGTMSSAFDDGPRNNRFQILLPDKLFLLMKMRALQQGISCNELICQAIQNELLKDPND